MSFCIPPRRLVFVSLHHRSYSSWEDWLHWKSVCWWWVVCVCVVSLSGFVSTLYMGEIESKKIESESWETHLYAYYPWFINLPLTHTHEYIHIIFQRRSNNCVTHTIVHRSCSTSLRTEERRRKAMERQTTHSRIPLHTRPIPHSMDELNAVCLSVYLPVWDDYDEHVPSLPMWNEPNT